jgi:hypothetical protein
MKPGQPALIINIFITGCGPSTTAFTDQQLIIASKHKQSGYLNWIFQ